MLKQGASQDVRLVALKSQFTEKHRLAAAGCVVSGQQVARELGLGNVSLVNVDFQSIGDSADQLGGLELAPFLSRTRR
jgi:hypothetical protein